MRKIVARLYWKAFHKWLNAPDGITERFWDRTCQVLNWAYDLFPPGEE